MRASACWWSVCLGLRPKRTPFALAGLAAVVGPLDDALALVLGHGGQDEAAAERGGGVEVRLVEHPNEGATVTRWRGAILVPAATEVMTAFCTVLPLNAKAELIDPASYASGHLMRDWVADM